MTKIAPKEVIVPKIKIQIEADDEEFDIEDIQNFLNDLQSDLFDDASASGHPAWIISIVNKNGSLTPLADPDKEDEEDDDEWDDEHNEYDDFEEDDDDEE